MTLRARAVEVRDAARTLLWPVPTAGVASAVLAGVLLPELDSAVADRLPDSVTGYLFGGGAAAARTVLDAVAGSLITVTSLTFSLTVVTLQLASGQFSPRLLRTFTRDRFVHYVLALFLATFVYALTVLRTVRSPDELRDQFVPQISVTVAFVLAVASVVALVLFLAHLAREIRVETILAGVQRDAVATIGRVLPAALAPPPPTAQSPASLPLPQDACLLLARGSGFLTSVDHADLCRAARELDGAVVVDRSAGEFVVAGTPVGRYWWEGAAPDHHSREAFEDAAADAIRMGKERTDTQDISFGLRQLTDVTSKALSPGINDPTTAVHALGHTSVVLSYLARRQLADLTVHDDQGRLRVVCRRPDFGQLLDQALSEPRRYGAQYPVVVTRLLTLLREVGWSVRTPHQRQAIELQLERLNRTIARQDLDQDELAGFHRCSQEVREALGSTWSR